MVDQAGRLPGYVLGHSDAELDRLAAQDAVYSRFTEHLLRESGIGPGLRVLDAGCGAGDVSLLVARLVGPEGSVVGIDNAPEALETARRRLAGAGARNASFWVGDIGSASLDGPFDAIVGRFILMHLTDPVAALRHLAGAVRPGGLVVFQESDFSNVPRSVPPAAVYEQCYRWLPGPRERHMGLKLYATFLGAGLPAPRLRKDVPLGGGPDFPGYEYLALSIRTFLERLERRGLPAPREEVDIETLADRLRDGVVAGGGVIELPAVVGAWVRLPGGDEK